MAKKEEQQPELSATSNKILAGVLNSKDYRDKHFNYEKRVDWKISTGSLLLDTYLDGGVSPSLLRVCGQNNEGKSPMVLEVVRQFLSSVKNSKTLWMLSEGRLSKENQERCGLKFVYTPEEWDVGTVFVLESNVYELFINCVKPLIKNNEEDIRYCFVVDSIDNLILSDDAKKEITDNNMVAGAPKLSKKMMQNLGLGMFKFGHLMILVSQVTAAIKTDMYERTPNRGGDFSGGNSLLHASDWILEFQKTFRGDYIYDTPNGEWSKDNPSAKTIGKYAKVQIMKSSLEASRYHIVKYPIKFGRKPSGIWLEKEVIDKFLSLGLITRKASWLSWETSLLSELKSQFPEIKEQIQGEHSMMKYLEDNPAITNFLYPKALSFSRAVFESK